MRVRGREREERDLHQCTLSILSSCASELTDLNQVEGLEVNSVMGEWKQSAISVWSKP